MDSILLSVKKMLGIESDYKHFDKDLIMHINSVLGILSQLGVGPREGYSIEDESDCWSDFLGDRKLEMVKTYMYLKVRMMFDPPLSSVTKDAITSQISELEVRINIEVDPERNYNV